MSQFQQVCYSELFAFLEKLGFQDESVMGSHVAFRHRPSATLILLAERNRDDPVRKEDFISVQQHLNANGLIDARTFGRQLLEASAREKPR